MTDRPILFSGEMVRSILAGRKTQTRRALKVQPLDILPMNVPNEWVALMTRDPNHGTVIKCRYGVPGDRLWVRETFTRLADHHAPPEFAYKADCTSSDGEEARQDYIRAGYPYQWKPSIHMPRWASRITLEVVRVRAERLQQITEADALAEGVTPSKHDIDGDDYEFTACDNFRFLWDDINGKRAPWVSNPFVWVVEFKRVQP